MNILITSAGRRVELVESFKESLSKLGLSNRVKVFCADLNPELSSACFVSDKSFKLPPAKSDNYIGALLQLCVNASIKLVIPTNDNELMTLAESREQFEELGVTLLISDKEIIKKCRDKRLTASIFESLGIRYPKVFEKDALKFPCFCKPYDGSSSIGAHVIASADELSESDVTNPRNMFMELISSDFKEYTVDAYFDRQHTLRGIVPRERLAVRAGEVAKGITRKNYVYYQLRHAIKTFPGAVGCLTIQVFGNPETEEVVGLEINPRFGGGYPLSVAAGADYSSMIVREYLFGELISDCDDWLDNTLMLRYDAKVVVMNAKI